MATPVHAKEIQTKKIQIKVSERKEIKLANLIAIKVPLRLKMSSHVREHVELTPLISFQNKSVSCLSSRKLSKLKFLNPVCATFVHRRLENKFTW